MGFLDFFVKDVETRDDPSKPALRTHYYKSEYRTAKDALLRYFNQKKLKVTNVDDTYGEIFVQANNYHMIVSIRRANVLNVSVDIKVSVYNMVGGNRPYKLINELYQYCDKQLNFIGFGLQPSY